MKKEPLIVATLINTCSACPAQWDGMLKDGRPIYVRYRWGYLSIRVGIKGGGMDSAVCGKEILGVQHGDDLDGRINEQELATLAEGVLDFSLLSHAS